MPCSVFAIRPSISKLTNWHGPFAKTSKLQLLSVVYTVWYTKNTVLYWRVMAAEHVRSLQLLSYKLVHGTFVDLICWSRIMAYVQKAGTRWINNYLAKRGDSQVSKGKVYGVRWNVSLMKWCTAKVVLNIHEYVDFSIRTRESIREQSTIIWKALTEEVHFQPLYSFREIRRLIPVGRTVECKQMNSDILVTLLKCTQWTSPKHW